MAELEMIAETLRRQRKDLEDQVDETLSRKSETAALIEQIASLRVRSEESRKAYESQAEESAPARPKK